MNLYFLSQDVNDEYDTYSDCVVCAKDEKDAVRIGPDGNECPIIAPLYSSWCSIKDIKCEYIGQAKKGLKRGVICSSFHAG